MKQSTMARRDFLKAGGSLVVAFSVPLGLTEAVAQAGAAKTVALDEVDGFIALGADGSLTVYSGKVDLGTGVRTALAQMAADELDVAFEAVKMVEGDTLLTPDQGPTFGSLTIQNGGMQIRQACATARAALIAEGAKRLGVPAEQCRSELGAVVAGGRRVAYAELIGGRDFRLKLDPKSALKPPSAWRIVGQSIPRVDIPAKVTGEFEYMQDFRRPGMLHARVVRPAGMGSKLQGYDDAAAKRIPAYVGTVRKGDFLAVVAKDEWSAIRAARAVKAQWSRWEGLPEKRSLYEQLRRTRVNKTETVQEAGNAAQALGGGARTLKATFDFAVHTHGSLGPSAAVAEWHDGRLEVWTASQATHLLQKQLAAMFALQPAQVRCRYVDGSGCYGRNGHEDAAADAALISRELGKPVRVQWTRAEEHGWDPKGPPTLLDYQGAIDASGQVVAWSSEVWIPDAPKAIGTALLAAEAAGMPSPDSHPGNIVRSLDIPYAFPNIRCVAHRLAETPFRPSWIRTPGRMQNTYGNEVFMDELAYAAGVDPLEFRLRYLKDARGIELLERLRQVAQWTPRPKPRGSGDIAHGRGVSYTKYEMVRTYVGCVADVMVNRQTGKIVNTRFTVVHDCGQIINPDGLRNQIEGNIVHTVSRTLIEDLDWNRSTVTSLDWQSYPVIAMPDVPDIVIDLIDRPSERPWGAGEPAAAVVPSAISNAVFDAVGVRMRSVPFTPDKVKAAMAAMRRA